MSPALVGPGVPFTVTVTLTGFRGGKASDGSMMEGDDGSMMEGDDGSMMEGDDGSMMEGDDGSMMEGDDGSMMEGDDGSMTDGDDGSMTDGDDGSMTDGDDGSMTDDDDGSMMDDDDGSMTEGAGETVDITLVFSDGSHMFLESVTVNAGGMEVAEISHTGLDSGLYSILATGSYGSKDSVALTVK